MLKRVLVAIFTLFAVGFAVAADKAIVYNHISDQPAELDKVVHQALGKRFKVVDVKGKERAYTKPVPQNSAMPEAPLLPDGNRLSGHVFVVYIVTAKGSAIEPHVISTSDTRLNTVALKAMKQWRFQPGSVDGKPVSIAAAQEFHFH